MQKIKREKKGWKAWFKMKKGSNNNNLHMKEISTKLKHNIGKRKNGWEPEERWEKKKRKKEEEEGEGKRQSNTWKNKKIKDER